MIFRILLILLGMILIVIGFTTIICYGNVLAIGYKFSDYIHVISTDQYCWCLPLGILIFIIYFFKGGKK